MSIFIKKFWFVIIIAIISVTLRLFKLNDLFYFSYDEAIPAFVGKNLYLLHKLPLIGGVTPFGFHLPPYFYWLLSILLSLGKLHPIAWGIASAFLSSITIILIYIVGKDFFNKRVGLYAAVLWSFSYIANLYDRHFWALYWGPILTLSTLFCLKKIINGNSKFVIPLSIAFVWAIATDPSNLVLIFLAITVYVLYRVKFKKTELLGILIIIFSLLPLMFFDLRHNFANTKPLLQYLKAQKTESRFENQDMLDRTAIFANSYTRLIYPFSDNEVAKQYSYCTSFINEKYQNIPIAVSLFSLLALTIFMLTTFKNKNGNKKVIISLLIMIYFLGIQAYGVMFNGDIFEHYITGLFPIFLLIAAYFLSYLPKKLAYVILAIFITANLYKLSIAQNSHGLLYKKQAIKFAMTQVGDKDFSLESLSTCWKYSGYRYLFAVYGREPVKSYVDPNFGHLYGRTPISPTHPETVIAFVTHDFKQENREFYEKYALYKSHSVTDAIFGNIEVLIMDNNSGWF